MPAPMAAEGIEPAPVVSVGWGLPEPESVGVFTLVMPVELWPTGPAPVPEAVPEGTTTGAEVTAVVSTAEDEAEDEASSYDEDGASVGVADAVAAEAAAG